MAANMAGNILRQEICKIQPITLLRRQFSGPTVVFNNPPQPTQSPSSAPTAPTPTINENVPGLSTAVHTLNEPVGPGASRSGEYKVPEYFNYNKISYFEAEIEMSKYRCPQPSAVNQ